MVHFISMFHIPVQNLSNSPNCTCHSRTLIFIFYLPLSCSGVIVYLASHRMVSTVGLGDSNFFPTDLPSLSFAYHHSNLLSQNLLLSDLGLIAHRWDTVVPIHTLLLLTCDSGLIYLGVSTRDYCLLWWGPSHLISPS